MLKNNSKRERGVLIDLYDDEKIVIIIRKHWFSFIGTIILTFILILVFFIASIFFYGSVGGVQEGADFSNLITDNLGRGAYLVFGSIYLLSVLGFFYVSWLDYYLDVFILTNKRILRIEQLVLFGQKSSETSYQHVQAVSSKVGGFIQSILHIGTVFVETAGDNDNFSFPIIRDPGGIATKILELQKRMWEDDDVRSDLSNDVKINKPVTPKKDIQTELKDDNEDLKNADNNLEESKIDISEIDEKINKLLEINTEKNQEGNDFEKRCLNIDGNRFCQVGPVIEFKKNHSKESKAVVKKEKIESVILEEKHYKDGRKITPYGVIWQSEQELTEDVLLILNQMER
uniref:DUF304 domain-containing protein n=1 Tax=candidate division CPR3 bacterium TaxID=2268181 RepID=A0A7C4R8L6_UNCC3